MAKKTSKKKASKKKASKKKASKKPAKKKAAKKKATKATKKSAKKKPAGKKKAASKKKSGKKKAPAKKKSGKGSRTVVETRRSRTRKGCEKTTTTRVKCPLGALLGSIESAPSLGSGASDQAFNELNRNKIAQARDSFLLALGTPTLRKAFRLTKGAQMDVTVQLLENGDAQVVSDTDQVVVLGRFTSDDAARSALRSLDFDWRPRVKAWRLKIPSILPDATPGNMQRDIDFRTGNRQSRLFGSELGNTPAGPKVIKVQLTKADTGAMLATRDRALEKVAGLAAKPAVDELLADARRSMLAARGAFDSDRADEGRRHAIDSLAMMAAINRLSPKSKPAKQLRAGELSGITDLAIKVVRAA